MFYIELAGLKIKIENKYDYICDLCKDYIVVNDKNVDFSVSASDEEILSEQTDDYPLGYLESLAVYRKIAERFTDYNGFLMHGAVIDFDEGTGIAFLAHSGVGKSTHINYWKTYYGNRVQPVNGDKPIIRIIDNKIYAYGTPWAGKERLQRNARVELKKICFIERAKENSCRPLGKNEILKKIIDQVYMDKSMKVFSMLGTIIETCEFYLIGCNMDVSAASVAGKAMGL